MGQERQTSPCESLMPIPSPKRVFRSYLRKQGALPEVDRMDIEEVRKMANFLASQVDSMGDESVAYGAYVTSAIRDPGINKLKKALLLSYRKRLVEWFEHALLNRARVGGGGPGLKKLQQGLSDFVVSLPDALLDGSPPAIDKHVPDNEYLIPEKMQPVANKIYKVLRDDALKAGVLRQGRYAARTAKDFPLRLHWDGEGRRWEVPSERRTKKYKARLRELGFWWDSKASQWYLPPHQIGLRNLPADVHQAFERVFGAGGKRLKTPEEVSEGRGVSDKDMEDWFYGAWLPSNIGRFTKVFSDYAANKQKSYSIDFSATGSGAPKVNFNRDVHNARDAVEELRYRYTNRSGREPWLEVLERFVDLVGASSPGAVLKLIDRINNLQHSNGLFMDHFPPGVKSWYGGFLNAKYSTPTAADLARFIPDTDLRDVLHRLAELESGRGSHSDWRHSVPRQYSFMVKELEEAGDNINWRAKQYPRYKGTVQIDRFDPAVQRGLSILQKLNKDREALLSTSVESDKDYQSWKDTVMAYANSHARAVENVNTALEAQDSKESRKDPLWWVAEDLKDSERATKWMSVNFPQEFIERFPYAVPGVSKSELAKFVARYAAVQSQTARYMRNHHGSRC